MKTYKHPMSDAPDVEVTAAPLRPVAHWMVEPAAPGRRPRLSMVWSVPQCENIAAVAASTSAY